MQAQIIDVVKRMKEITLVMQTPGVRCKCIRSRRDVGRASGTCRSPMDMANDKQISKELNERPVCVSLALKEGFNLLLFVQELNERPVRVSLATARVTRTELGCISRKKRLIRIRNAFRKLHH
ncbi:hypothetical protein Tco_0693893 [Tanacetum coccineum]